MESKKNELAEEGGRVKNNIPGRQNKGLRLWAIGRVCVHTRVHTRAGEIISVAEAGTGEAGEGQAGLQ